ncbi:MerR family transcriptional regulator [Nonomuraea angiospora]|uniref:helix-turn-helix domain-containing protein n=1 Tax=Nonomuraea angiospora TaxID=46172 RepID=UPI0034263574
MSDIWTIGELAERAALALRASTDGAPAANGRVRDVPGERLIRWYTTIGLLDPPLTRRGRIAQYGRRHLLQLVAVKRLQAAGHSIAQIQTALAGATDRMLETAAGAGAPPTTGATRDRRGPGSSEAPDGAHPAADARPSSGAAERRAPGRGATEQDAAGGGESARGRFWAERPGKGSVRAPEAARQLTEPADGPRRPSGAAESVPGGTPENRSGGRAVVVGVRLGDGVRLVLDAGRVPSEEDVQAVLAAAGPLLAVLEERELI